jgi:hypothetical protein
MTRLRLRRQVVTRRTFLAATVSVLAIALGQACIDDAAAQLGGESPTTPTTPGGDQEPVQAIDPSGQPGAAPGVRPAPPALINPTSAGALVNPAAPSAVSSPTSLSGFVYAKLPDPDVPDTIRPESVALPNLVREPGQPLRLRGLLVEVVNHGVVVDRDPKTGKLVGVAMGNAETSSPDGFDFRPRSGGPLTWQNEDAAGAENGRALEAARFGEVNAYYHADRTIAYANSLLAELGERPLPFLRVVVNAHSCSRLPGYRKDDGDRRGGGKLWPFPGGHYRLPTTLKPEAPFRHPIDEMNPTGEVHLGIGNSYILNSRDRPVTVDGRPYAKNASHVPGIVVHETGHHITSHTADFFVNRDRKVNEYVNRKIHMDEGTADYWAAVLLETPDIFNWQHVAEDIDDRDNRDLSGPRTTRNFTREEHRDGNIWSSTLWDVRKALGARPADMLVMKTLVLLGRIGPELTKPDDASRQAKIELKDELREGLAMVLEADKALYDGTNRSVILDIFKRRGIDLTTPDRNFGKR